MMNIDIGIGIYTVYLIAIQRFYFKMCINNYFVYIDVSYYFKNIFECMHVYNNIIVYGVISRPTYIIIHDYIAIA